MMDIQIATYWNVETLYYVFNAVAAMMAGDGYAGLIKLMFLFAIGIGMFVYMAGKQLELFTWFFQALIFVSLLNMPIARVTLTDNANIQPPRVVDHVPFVMAIIAQTTNLTFGFLTRQYEVAFGVPESLALAQGDVGFGHRILKQVNQSSIQEPGLRSDLMQFFKECTQYDIKDGVIPPQMIIGGTDVWNALFTQTSPARFVTYDTLSSAPVTATCTDAAVVLKDRVDSAVIAAQTFYGKQAFPLAQSDAIATSLYINATGSAYDWILQSSQNASDATRQAMFNNIWREAGTSLPAMLNDPSLVAETAALSAEAQAAAQANGSNSVMSLLGQETLPHLRNWMEAILYAMFPIIVILAIAMTSEGAKKVLGGYMMALAWIGMWPVLFAVINHLSMMYMKHKANALSLAAGVPFQLSDTFSATLVNEQAVIGYMVVLVPFIAAGIIRMGQGGFMGVADRAFSSFTSAGGAAGAALATGNVSMGQVGMDTQSTNTTSMNKMDYGLGLEGGGASIGTASGGVARLSSNGAAALQQMHNRFMTSMSTDTRLDSQRSQEAHETNIEGRGNLVSNRVSNSSSLSQVTGSDTSRGAHQIRGVEAATSHQGEHRGSTETRESMQSANRDSSAFHIAAGASDRAGMGLGRSSPNSGASVQGIRSGVDQKEEKRIVESMKNAGASQEAINKALGNYRTSKSPGGSSPTGSSFNASLNVNSTKTYDASHTRNKGHDESHTTDDTAGESLSYSESGSRTSREGQDIHSSQNSRHAIDANLSNVDEHSMVSDTVERQEHGIGHRSSRGENISFSTHRDLLADPAFMNAVAQRNGMSAMRFYSQEAPTIMSMAQSYADESSIVADAQRLNNSTLTGAVMPLTKAELRHQFEHDSSGIPDDINAKHKARSEKIGFTGSSPLTVNTALPDVASKVETAVHSALDPKSKNSIPSRSSEFDENVQAWASHDKKVGEGRANPMAVVEEVEGRDVTDTMKKTWDKLTGGDGMADGEKLNNNKKNDAGSTIKPKR